MITQEELKKVINYNPETGKLIRYKDNREVGHITTNGYLRIYVGGKQYMAHRLVWLWMYGKFPENLIDHVNGIKTDNRLVNLRECTNSENCQNRTKILSSTGYLGVHKHGNRFKSRITVNNKEIVLGIFDTAEEGYQAYLEAKKKYHTFSPVPKINTCDKI